MSEDPKGFDAGDYNLFRYVHNDPADLTDPMGTSSAIWSGVVMAVAYWKFSDAKLEQDFKKAYNFLPREMRQVIDKVAANKQRGVLVTRSNEYLHVQPQYKAYPKRTSGIVFEFKWNPQASLVHSQGTQSPAMVLGHEAAHAERFLRDPLGFIRDNRPSGLPGHRLFPNREEERVITGIEARAARILREAPRSKYEGVHVEVDDVTQTRP
jgi:hypothetical protein